MSAPTYADFLADPLRRERTIVDITGMKVSDLSEATYRFSTDDWATEPSDSPANQLYENRVVAPFERSTTAIGSDGPRYMNGFLPSTTEAVVRLKQYFGDLDLGSAPCMGGVPMREVSFGGRRILIRHGGSCAKGPLPLSAYRVLTDGVVQGQPSIGPTDVAFKVRDKGGRLDSPAQSRTLFGTDMCVVFNGTTSAINCGNNSAFDFTSGNFTASFLIYVEAYPANEAFILCRGALNTNGWAVNLGTAGGIRLRTNQAGASQVTTSSALPLHRWVHVLASRVGAAVTIMFDGEVVTSTVGTHVNPTTTTSNLFIGRNNAGGATTYFAGALDEIRIKDSATTEDEFEEVMQRPLDSDEYASYLGYWSCEDGSGASVTTLDNQGSVGSAGDGTVTSCFFAPSCMGRSDSAGRRMPSTWGQFRGFEPVPVDTARSIYLVHSEEMEELTTVRVGGLSAYTTGTTYTSWLAFVIASTTAGAVDRCLSPGWSLFRIGGEPKKKITVDGKGDKSDGTYRYTTASIIRHMATTLGIDPFDDSTEIDDAVFDAFDAAHAGIVGYTFADDRTVAQAISDMAQTYGAALWIKRASGLLSIKQFSDPSLETAVCEINRHSILRGGLEPMERGSPFGKLILRYAENPTPMGAGELSESVNSGDKEAAAFYRQRWRKSVREAPLVRRRYLDAVDYDVATRFASRSSANVEKLRLSQITRTPDQGFSFHCRHQAVELDFGDVVALHVQDLNRYNELQDRFGTTAVSNFYIVGISDKEEGGYVLDLWRPKVV